MKVNESKKRSLNLVLILFLLVNIINSFALLAAYGSTHISPQSFVYLAFFGLTYPVWISIELFFIAFWFFFRRKLVWISILTILLGVNHLRHFFAVNFSDPVLKNPVKVMSYNLRNFGLYSSENSVSNRDSIFSFLEREAAGIYCFQEFYHQEGDKGFVHRDEVSDLLNAPFYHERYTHALSNKRYFGVATFSKYPIVNKGEIAFDNDPNNFCIYTDFSINNDTVRVFNAHIGSIRFQDDDYRFFDEKVSRDYYKDNEVGQRILRRLKVGFEKRAEQAEVIVREIQSSPYPVILCGDLNDTPVSYCYRQFNSVLNDAFIASGNGIGTTYIGEIPSNRIDYIFYSEPFEAGNFTSHQIKFSDHRPISCEIGSEVE